MLCFVGSLVFAQKEFKGKAISPDLFGIFYEDISYAADGGLYAELLQNRSFEYSPSDKDNWSNESNWQPLTAWEFETDGFGYGSLSIETKSPIHSNNPHYVVVEIEEEGKEGIGLINHGYDGITVKAGETYNFSAFLKPLTKDPFEIVVQLRDENGKKIAVDSFSTNSTNWKNYKRTLTASAASNQASLVILIKTKGKLALDMISLFPQKTFKNRPNGMRDDLAQVIADLHPKFMRFPGGCVVHGDGLGNMYRWQNTIGPLEERVEIRNIWGYRQSMGLGYFEYFQFCEDIGAKPVPVVAAGVSCQNSGGTWRIPETSQKCFPLEDMDAYIQEVLDLVEYANGSATSKFGSKRAEAGHPKPFDVEYLGIGNEDKITPEFEERFKLIEAAVKAKYPEITIIGTVGPGPDGDDYEKGWALANELDLEVVDEHFYETPEWFLNNLNRYDDYDRTQAKVYIGEFAAHDSKRSNNLRTALAEAAFMTSIERNGDLVSMVSYAPLLARKDHISWSPDLIYFTDEAVLKTANYYVQKLFSNYAGDVYYDGIFSFKEETEKELVSTSCVKQSLTGDIVLKLVNTNEYPITIIIDLSPFRIKGSQATKIILTGDALAENTFENPDAVVPQESSMQVKSSFLYEVPANSLTVIRTSGK